MPQWLSWVLRTLALVLAHAVLFAVGAQLLGPDLSGTPLVPTDEQTAALMLLVMAAIDTAILLAIVRASRLSGWRLMLLLALLIYGVKTLTSGIEAWYFMNNLTAEVLPGLFRMTLLFAILFPPLLVWLGGRMRPDLGAVGPAWQLPARGLADTALRVAILAAVVYPVLFFSFGYFVAWQSAAVRAFYGSTGAESFLQQMAIALSDRLLYPFEVLRGLLWVAFAVPVLATTRGRWWVGTLLAALVFAFVQNDVHLLPNPLMPAEVRLFHFIETASSNFIWAWAIGLLLAGPRGGSMTAVGRRLA